MVLTLSIGRARASPSEEVGMEEGPSSGKEDGGAGVSELPAGNLRVASGDPNLSQIMQEIKSSKSPVRDPLFFAIFRLILAFPCLLFSYEWWANSLDAFEEPFLIKFSFWLLSFSCLQAVINYGASWYVPSKHFCVPLLPKTRESVCRC